MTCLETTSTTGIDVLTKRSPMISPRGFAASLLLLVLPYSTFAFEFEDGQRLCVSDNSLACTSVWEIEQPESEADGLKIRQYRLLNVHKDTDLPIEKWASARNKQEFLFESLSSFKFEPPSETNQYRADPIRICETDLLEFSMDGVETVTVKQDDGTTVTQQLVDGMRAEHLERAQCFEVSVCSQKVGQIRHERIFMRVYIQGEEQPENAAFLRELGWLERSKGVLVPSHLLLGNINWQPAKCG